MLRQFRVSLGYPSIQKTLSKQPSLAPHFLKLIVAGCEATQIRGALNKSGNIMNLELIAQLVSLFLIMGAGPIVVVLLFARGGNL